MTVEDIERETDLSRSLNAFFRCLSEDGFGEFVGQVRPMSGSRVRSLYLGAFQSYSRLVGAYQPCILLLSLTTLLNIFDAFSSTLPLNTPASTMPFKASEDSAILVFARLMWFSTMVKWLDVHKGEEWALKTCYIKTSTDTELLRRGLSLGHQSRPWISYKFWTWRTSSKHFKQLAFNVSTTEVETRRCLHIKSHGASPGCLILVAAKKGSYWISHQIGGELDVEAEANRFEIMDLEPVWVTSAREIGPIGADRMEFESETLFTTLVIDRMGVFDRYKVSLAILDKEGTGRS